MISQWSHGLLVMTLLLKQSGRLHLLRNDRTVLVNWIAERHVSKIKLDCIHLFAGTFAFP